MKWKGIVIIGLVFIIVSTFVGMAIVEIDNVFSGMNEDNFAKCNADRYILNKKVFDQTLEIAELKYSNAKLESALNNYVLLGKYIINMSKKAGE